MNNLEKRSLYAFLSLYILSSTLFILLSSYWYFSAQRNSLQSNEYYKLEHIADTLSRQIISAHMQGSALDFESIKLEKDIFIALVDIENELFYGALYADFFPSKADYFELGAFNILISDAPQRHLNTKFVIVQSNQLSQKLSTLKKNILISLIFFIAIMIVLAIFLSRFFMRPLHQKIKQIEDFVHDTAHELNTPITALSMSVSRALKKQTYDEKSLKNISISTKQLFDIYNALSYLSFESEILKPSALEIATVLEQSVEYYQELAQSKRIQIIIQTEPFEFKIEETKLIMLFGNLISNAIKYSEPLSKIEVNLKNGLFSIKDYGIGIEEEKLAKIFERFERATKQAGGFGIGLSIVKKITLEYDLNIDVYSKPREGTLFTVQF